MKRTKRLLKAGSKIEDALELLQEEIDINPKKIGDLDKLMVELEGISRRFFAVFDKQEGTEY